MISFCRQSITVVLFALIVFTAPSIEAASGKIIVGVVPEVNLVKQMDRFVPLSDYLDKKTGYDVEIKPLSNYGHLYEDMRDGNVDAGFFGSFVYCMTRARIGVVPIARPVLPGGRSTYSGILFIRNDVGIKKSSDLKGKTIALADPATSGGYLAQKDYLAGKGINIDKDMKIVWVGSHEAAIRAVMSHQAEVGGAKDSIVKKYRKENKVFDTLIEIINETPSGKGFPDNTFAVRKGLEQVKIDALKKALLHMDTDPEGKKVLQRFGAVRFIPTSDDDFKPLYDLVRHLRIDLASYPYKKNGQ
ncbi:MAG TPA: phosphate/phosphite/phosphonate ABC transporter substrate-binding protein [Geobacteraceae bacterium]|nr:phosphate/phosphite/phosphonate ABC transporter substrate-binding protein [Geobacteraceae bacterium]